jgi:hypothetical protein
MDVIIFCFHKDLPQSFHKKEEDAKENNNHFITSSTNSNNGKGKCKGTKKKESSNKRIKNDNLIAEFKMADGETWEKTFQAKCPDSRVKFMGTYMCLHFHMKRECWSKGCKCKKLNIPAAKIPDDKKGRHQSNRKSGQGLAVPNHAQLKKTFQQPQQYHITSNKGSTSSSYHQSPLPQSYQQVLDGQKVLKIFEPTCK